MKVFIITVLALANAQYCPQCNQWTRFYNRDNQTGLGDSELLSSHRYDNPNEICAEPEVVEARSTSGITGEVVSIGPDYGFSCSNFLQEDGQCEDYAVRFCCRQGTPVCPIGFAWTAFYDRDNATETGDYETLSIIRKFHPGVCRSPRAIDVLVASTGYDYRSAGESVCLCPSRGFACQNVDQDDGQCEDYKIRFCCPV
ncbi:hypothetical protein SNE40_008691 [Patella caerulea]|uniref:WxxW domain-containing protein n=1 Tax=Patella caerulea TaxID=87958 RepID=A0AAN8PWL9_PATCE